MLNNAIGHRRSIRRFVEGYKISDEELQELLEAAMSAPSAHNTRPWDFVVVENREMIDKLMEIHPHSKMLKTASLAIIVCGRPDLQENMENKYWPQDCAAATQNILLQATYIGLGACWCGVYPDLQRTKEIKELLKAKGEPVALIAVGKPDEHPNQRGFYEKEKITIYR